MSETFVTLRVTRKSVVVAAVVLPLLFLHFPSDAAPWDRGNHRQSDEATSKKKQQQLNQARFDRQFPFAKPINSGRPVGAGHAQQGRSRPDTNR